jgi:ssDNA-binding replication factor A large subunit
MLDRYFTRGYIVKKYGLDDLFIAFAVTLGGAQTVTHILQVENGSGRHASMLHVEEFNNMLLVCWFPSWYSLILTQRSTGGSTC